MIPTHIFFGSAWSHHILGSWCHDQSHISIDSALLSTESWVFPLDKASQNVSFFAIRITIERVAQVFHQTKSCKNSALVRYCLASKFSSELIFFYSRGGPFFNGSPGRSERVNACNFRRLSLSIDTESTWTQSHQLKTVWPLTNKTKMHDTHVELPRGVAVKVRTFVRGYVYFEVWWNKGCIFHYGTCKHGWKHMSSQLDVLYIDVWMYNVYKYVSIFLHGATHRQARSRLSTWLRWFEGLHEIAKVAWQMISALTLIFGRKSFASLDKAWDFLSASAVEQRSPGMWRASRHWPPPWRISWGSFSWCPGCNCRWQQETRNHFWWFVASRFTKHFFGWHQYCMMFIHVLIVSFFCCFWSTKQQTSLFGVTAHALEILR